MIKYLGLVSVIYIVVGVPSSIFDLIRCHFSHDIDFKCHLDVPILSLVYDRGHCECFHYSLVLVLY